MNKKAAIALGIMVLFLANIGSVLAADPAKHEMDVDGTKYQTKIMAHEQYQFRFMQRTQIRLNASVNMSVNIDCDAQNIGDKTISVEILSANASEVMLNMTCRETEAEFGIGDGVQVRNRERVRLNAGFAMQLEANCSCEAKLGAAMTADEAKDCEWAYYNETTDEWVPVESTYEDGMLTAVTDHFSVWTVITVEEQTIPMSTIGIIAFALLGIAGAVLFYRKKKATVL